MMTVEFITALFYEVDGVCFFRNDASNPGFPVP